MPPRGLRRDLSKQPGNPTHVIEKNYSRLMSIQDPGELVEMIMGLVKPLIGSGISSDNFRKFNVNLQQAGQRGLDGIRFFLTNFMMAGSGMRVEDNAIVAIASVISEDVNVRTDLTPRQRQLKEMVEHHGFHVVLIM
jgi:hypothetical protein